MRLNSYFLILIIKLMKIIAILIVLHLSLARQLYENYSFDYSAHKTPIAYSSYGNAIELTRKVKLSSKV